MNNDRRKELNQINSDLSALAYRVEMMMDEETDAYENLPEGLQSSEQGETMQEAIDALTNAQGSIEEAIEQIEEAVQ